MTKTEINKLKAEGYDLVLRQAQEQRVFRANNQAILNRLNEIAGELKQE